MSVFHNNALAGASGQTGGAAAYEIERSLRFNSADSAYLNRTPSSAGNRKTWTWSGWVKKQNSGYVFSAYQDASNYTYFNFSSDKIRFGKVSGGSASYTRTTAVFRDSSAWYHFQIAVDTTQATGSDRIRIYVNGVQFTNYEVTWTPSQNEDLLFNSTNIHTLGNWYGSVGGNGLDGYLADVHFIDGQALDPTDFGEFDDNNVWQPIAYAGTYGTNGFHLDFSDNSSASALGTDSSGNGNDWTVNNLDPGPISTTVAGMAWSSALGTEPTWSNFPSLTTIDTDSLADPTSFTINSFSGVGSNLYFGYWWSSDGASWTRSGSNGLSPPYTVTPVSRYLRLALAGGTSVTSATAGTETFTSAFVTGSDSRDSPTNGTQTDTGAGGEVSGNYCTLNPLDIGTNTSLTNGNLEFANTTTEWNSCLGTVFVSSGKWYAEAVVSDAGVNGFGWGIAKTGQDINNYVGVDAKGWGLYGNGASSYTFHNGSYVSSSYTSLSNGDILGMALDMDAGTLTYYVNNVSKGVAFTGITGQITFAVTAYGGSSPTIFNFGQRPFAYTAPSGFKALCTANLDDPTIADGSTAMDVALYTGNGSTNSISGLGFSPDLVWIKSRTNAYYHRFNDTVRGVQKLLYSTTDAESTSTLNDKFNSFDSNGFTLGSATDTAADGMNQNTSTYVAWTWDGGSSTVANTDGSITSSVRANASAGFSIVSYTGTGANATVGHGLGVAPAMVIIKSRTTSGFWVVGHTSIGFTSDNYLVLDTTAAAGSGGGVAWNNTAPTSTVVHIGSSSVLNGNGNNLVMYCWAPVEGYSAFGSYTGNGSTDGPFVYTGFKPAFVMIKCSSTSGDGWFMVDNKRPGYNLIDEYLLANASTSEQNANVCDFCSNGFKIRYNYTGTNSNGATYIYAAFAENPFKYARAR